MEECIKWRQGIKMENAKCDGERNKGLKGYFLAHMISPGDENATFKSFSHFSGRQR